jgi:hypothetical protein
MFALVAVEISATVRGIRVISRLGTLKHREELDSTWGSRCDQLGARQEGTFVDDRVKYPVVASPDLRCQVLVAPVEELAVLRVLEQTFAWTEECAAAVGWSVV